MTYVALFTHVPDAPSAEGEVSGEGYTRAPLDGAVVFSTVVASPAWVLEDWWRGRDGLHR